LSVDRASIALNGIYGSAWNPADFFQVNGDETSWQVESSAPWLVLEAPNGTTGNSHVVVQADMLGLDVGTYAAQVTVRDLADARTVTIDVTLTVSLPVLSTTTDHLTFDGTFGWSDLTRPVDVTFELGFTDYPVTLDLSFPIADAIDAEFVGGDGIFERRRLNVTIDPASMHGGHHAGTLTLHANVRGHTISHTIAIEATGSRRIVYPSADGVAFTRIDTGPPLNFVNSFLTRTLSVLDSYGVAGTPWTATSDQSWLSVTSDGVSDGTLVLTADPTGLAYGLHWATVSISSPDSNVERTLPIRVSLWLATPWPNSHDALLGAYVQLASDPVRPYVYAHNGSSTIDIYHAHAHTLLSSVGPLSGTLGPMVTSTDGRWLFVLDPTNGSVTRIDLDDTAVRTTWPLLDGKPSGEPSTLVYARPSGHPVLLLSDGRVVDAASGSVFPTGHIFTLPLFDIAKASPNGDRVCVLNTQQSPFSGACFKLLYGDQGPPDVKHSPLIGFDGFSVPGGGAARDLAFMQDGGSIVVALESNPRPLVRFSVLGGYNGPLISDDPAGTIYSARAVTLAADGAIHAQIINGSDGFERLLVLNANESKRIYNYYIEGNVTTLYGQLVTSGDARGTVFLAGDIPPMPTTSSTVQFVMVPSGGP
jgi:hypothetical protein